MLPYFRTNGWRRMNIWTRALGENVIRTRRWPGNSALIPNHSPTNLWNALSWVWRLLDRFLMYAWRHLVFLDACDIRYVIKMRAMMCTSSVDSCVTLVSLQKCAWCRCDDYSIITMVLWRSLRCSNECAWCNFLTRLWRSVRDDLILLSSLVYIIYDVLFSIRV